MIAYFDLDRTVIKQNSALLYAHFERRHGRISWRQFLTSGIWTGLYHLNLLDIDVAYQKATKLYQGVSEVDIRQRTADFFHGDVKHLLLPEARDRITSHRLQGHKTVLLTNGSCYQAQEAATAWGFDDWIATEFELKEGKLTGNIIKPLCYGAGKLQKANMFATKNRESLLDAYFYTDSYSDLPMLEGVGHPIVVNPDPKLLRHAKRVSWPIYRWVN